MRAKTPVTACKTPQWNSSEAKALIVRTSGKAWNARMKLAPGWVSTKGKGGPAR